MDKKKRSIFIGDIQGCYDELKLLLKKMEITSIDKVYFVGDLINKGPKSWKVLKLLYKNSEQFQAVLGNHEVNFLRWLDSGLYDGDISGFEKLKEKLEENPKILDYLRTLPLYIEKKHFILLHGGLIPGKDIDDHSIDEITRIRELDGKAWYEYYKGDKKVIYGHWALDGLRLRKNTVGLDTGCVYGKAMTAYILETGEIIQQQALNVYVNVYK